MNFAIFTDLYKTANSGNLKKLVKDWIDRCQYYSAKYIWNFIYITFYFVFSFKKENKNFPVSLLFTASCI